jgi:hypothetical protein
MTSNQELSGTALGAEGHTVLYPVVITWDGDPGRVKMVMATTGQRRHYRSGRKLF